MNRDLIGLFKAVLDSYEDIAIFSVLDETWGLIEVIYPSTSEHHLKSIMDDMENYGIVFQEVSDVQ